MLRKSAFVFLFLAVSLDISAFGQSKRALEHEDVNEWNAISNTNITRDGNWVVWTEAPARGDGALHVSSRNGSTSYSVSRGTSPRLSGDSRFLLFKIVPQADSVRQAKLDDVPKKDMPSDSLGIMNLKNGSIQKFASVSSFKVSTHAGALAAFMLTKEASKVEAPADSSATEEEEVKEGSRGGSRGGHQTR